MILTNTPFKGSNFHGWNRNVRMELGAKLKLGFIDGSCPKPGIGDVELQRWIRCDYMVTCWILNSMVTELSDAFLYAQSASHTVDQCFEKIGYPDWYKGNKAKKQGRIAANVSVGFDDHFSGDTPFDVDNEIGVNQGGGFDQKLVAVDPSTNQIMAVGKGSRCLYICKPIVDHTSFSTSIYEFPKSHLNSIPSTCLYKESYNNYVSKNVLDAQTFHARLGHSSVSKLVSFPKSDSISSAPFHLIHLDLWGPYKQAALNGAQYFFTIVDDNTRATWTYLVQSKEQISNLLVSYFAYVKTHFQSQPKIARSDNRTEINGRVERKHKHLLDTARALRLQANLPLKFWGDCILTATYLINKMPVKLLDWKSPYEKLYRKPATYDHLRVIGCLCNDAIVKDVVFEETVFSFKQPITPLNDQFLPTYLVFETNPLEETVIPNTPLPATTHTRNSDFNEPTVENVAQPVAEPVQNDPLPFTSSYVPFKDIPSTHVAFLANVFATLKPTSYKQAITHERWVKAMKDELAALERNETWTITSIPEGHKPITSKWVFKTKYKPNETVERLKARLVVRGFNQQEGLDYKDTFSPVAKLATVRVLIALATVKQWPLHQLDINNAFLHGYIDDEIYMLPHEGYNKASKRQVCKLSKSLYGLKQASRKWNHELTKFLLSLGYVQSKHDYSLFVKTKDEEFTTFFVYVDDMLITGNSQSAILNLKSCLEKKFTIKDLGLAKYFLGIELCKIDTGMHLNQRKYILELLTHAGLTAAKPSSFPLPTQLNLSLDKGTPLRCWCV
ncbi:retrovirus-related pol polyprotein from transposon TNT 1-94 [Tanacetum coccineum]